MRVSHIHTQQTLLMLNNKKSQEEIEREIEARCNGIINHISIFNSQFDRYVLPRLNENIEALIIRKCKMVNQPAIQIFGMSLKTVELPYCQLKYFPIIQSECLQKLNVSNNLIQQILSLSNKHLKILDLRNNKILRVTRQIYSPTITVLHEFLSIKKEKPLLSLPMCLYPLIIDTNQLINQSIESWSKTELIETCELIVQNNNQTLLKQLLPYLTEEFIAKIFQISRIKKKHSIIDLLINFQGMSISEQQAISLLMPEFVTRSTLYKINLNNFIKVLSSYNSQKQRVLRFLDHLASLQDRKSFFIQSQKDLINFMSYNVNFPNNYQCDFLITQLIFFDDYDFSNRTILQYLLQFDDLKLLRKLLQLPLFREKMFAFGLFKKLIKPNKKIMKILMKEEKMYKNQLKSKSQLYFPEYKERRSFCLKNDVYDYQILTEYQQMQGSYYHKDLRFTLKFCNKQNEISIAKRIETQLKRNNLKTMQIRRSHYSTSSSIPQL